MRGSQSRLGFVIRTESTPVALEAESIEVSRETAAAYRKPVMLYCFGNESSVRHQLARKALMLGPISVPQIHEFDNWKFKETISSGNQLVHEFPELNLSEQAARIIDGETECYLNTRTECCI